MTREEADLKLLDQFVAQLAEHFDTVQIFASRHEGDEAGTVNAHKGSGNWFSRYGQVACWVDKQKARILIDEEDEDV